MCGIVCVLGEPLPKSQFKAACQALTHRGPDGEGMHLSNDIMLGHRLLQIRTDTLETQPVYTGDKSIMAVVNGEFYDADSLRQQLMDKGCRFRGQSDSELLVHLYQIYGTELFKYLNGEFAFVLWDTKRKRLLAARDRFGIKPLYWTRSQNRLLLASESKAFFELGVVPEWNTSALEHVLTHQYLCPDQSLFDGVHQVRPGTYLSVMNGNLTAREYWRPLFDGPTGQAEPSNELRLLLRTAIKRRLVGHVKKAIYLSGGIDSASIAAIAAEESAEPLTCYTVSFSDPAYDEAPAAAQIAAHCQLPFVSVPVSQIDLLTHLEAAVWMGESLAINGQLSAKLILSKRLRADGIKVVLSGEGADEALLGYPHFKQDWGDTLRPRPQWMDALGAAHRLSKGVFLPQFSTVADREYPTFLRSKLEFSQILKALSHPNCFPEQARVLHRLYQSLGVGSLSGVRQAQQAWIQLALANYILRGIGDGMEMANSIEGRPPFLDPVLFEWALRQPIDQHINPNTGLEKWTLRRAMQYHLPPWVLQRRKHPFIAPPIHQRKNTEVRSFIQDTLASNALSDLPFLDAQKIRQFSYAESLPEAPLMLILSLTLLQKRMAQQRQRMGG